MNLDRRSLAHGQHLEHEGQVAPLMVVAQPELRSPRDGLLQARPAVADAVQAFESHERRPAGMRAHPHLRVVEAVVEFDVRGRLAQPRDVGGVPWLAPEVVLQGGDYGEGALLMLLLRLLVCQGHHRRPVCDGDPVGATRGAHAEAPIVGVDRPLEDRHLLHELHLRPLQLQDLLGLLLEPHRYLRRLIGRDHFVGSDAAAAPHANIYWGGPAQEW
mmetsp:Transcript_11859/g.32428  ORF Transcript_11859/g.32428 Transcript_11859/m.32428 type:complete len:216 (-) Transcript_11859:24-671(-)